MCGPRRVISLGLLFRIGAAGYAINFLTPSASLAGEVTKGALLASHQSGPEATSSVFIDKLCGAIGHLVLVVTGSVFILWHVTLPKGLWAALLLSNLLISSGVVAFFWLQKQGQFGSAARWVAARRRGNQRLQRLASDLTRVDGTLRRFHETRRVDLLWAIGWHTLGHGVGILQTWLFLSFVNQSRSLIDVATAGVLCLWFDFATFVVPLNLGTLEGSRILALKSVGYTTLMGMTYGVALRLAQLFWSGFGLLNYFFLMRSSSDKRATLQTSGLEAEF
jgi:hypothetical protein